MSDVSAYQKAVLDKYDIGEADLDTILRTVGTVDASYQTQLIACANTVDEFAQRICNLADMISPQVLSYAPTRYADLGRTITINYAAIARLTDDDLAAEQGAVDQTLDAQQPWYEKLLNGVGGFAVGVVDGVVFAPASEVFALVDQMTGGHLHNDVDELREQMDSYVLNTYVTNEQWYFGGKAVGDATAVAGGLAMSAGGLVTIAGGDHRHRRWGRLVCLRCRRCRRGPGHRHLLGRGRSRTRPGRRRNRHDDRCQRSSPPRLGQRPPSRRPQHPTQPIHRRTYISIR
jgi:hypothetical protein